MNHNHKPCFTSKQGLFYLFDVMGMSGAVGTIFLLAGLTHVPTAPFPLACIAVVFYRRACL